MVVTKILLVGSLIALVVYVSLGFKQIKSEEEEEEERSIKRQNSNLHPDDMGSKLNEIMCVAFARQRQYE